MQVYHFTTIKSIPEFFNEIFYLHLERVFFLCYNIFRIRVKGEYNMFKTEKRQAQERAKETENPFTTIDPSKFLGTFYKENEYNTKLNVILNQYTLTMLNIVNDMQKCLPVDKIEQNAQGVYTMDNDKLLLDLTYKFAHTKECALAELNEELKMAHISFMEAYTNEDQDIALDSIESYMYEIDAIKKAELASLTTGQLIKPSEKMRRICEYVSSLNQGQMSETSGSFPECAEQKEIRDSDIVFQYNTLDRMEQHDTAQTLSPKIPVENNTTTVVVKDSSALNAYKSVLFEQVSTTESEEQHDTAQTNSPAIFAK